MAVAATQQVIADGPHNLVLKYTLIGSSGDLTASILVNASTFNDADGVALGANSLSLMGVQGACVGFTLSLLWEASADVPLIYIPEGQTINQDFSKFGGIKDNSTTTSSGDVVITTAGYTAATGDGGHLYLWFRKT